MREWSTLRRLMLLKGATGSAVIEATATGNPLKFITDKAKPLKSLLIPFTPQQSGTGDPSPSNIRSIIPWDGLKVWSGGVNTFDGELEKGYINTQGQNANSNDNVRSKNYIPVVPGTQYYVKFERSAPGASNMRVFFYSADKTYISNGWRGTGTMNVPSNAYFIRFYMDSAYTAGTDRSIAINYPATETNYEAPHITDTDIVFPSPVYGGTLDVVSGVLTVEWIAHTFDGTESLLKNGTFTGGVRFLSSTMTGLMQTTAYCDKMYALTSSITTITKLSVKIGSPPYQVEMYVPDNSIVEGEATKEDFTSWLSENNVTVVARLTTPQEIQLTPQQITTLLGNNTIRSDADGSMTAVYLKKK